MSTKRVFAIVLVAGFVLLAASAGPWVAQRALALPSVQAGVTIPYSGNLADEAGQPVADGAYAFSFALYAVEGGGGPVWAEQQEGIMVQGGAFTAMLGSTNPLPQETVDGGARWLEVGVRGPGEAEFTLLAPRQELSTAAPASPASPSALSCAHDHVGEVWNANVAWSNGALKVVNYGNGPSIWGWNGGGGNAIRGYGLGNSLGVYGESVDNTGVTGRSTGGYGVVGESTNADAAHFVAAANDGVYGSADGGGMWGVWGTSNDSHGLYGNTDVSGGYGVYSADKIYASGGCVGCTLMLLARNGGEETLEPGDVVVLAGIAAAPSEIYSQPTLLVHRAGAAPSQAIVGVVEGRYVSELVTKEEGVFEDAHTTTEPVAPGETMTVIYRGLAQVRVDASFGIIQVGDRLAPSDTSGYAMLATAGQEAESGRAANTTAIIGTALEPLDRGQGLIWVLIDLQ